MINIETTVRDQQVRDRIRTVQQRISSLFEDSWLEWQVEIDKQIQLALRGKSLQTRSGMLRRLLTWASLQREGENYKVVLESGTPYARIQDLGGKVKAKPGRALAIPLDAVKTRAGLVKKPPLEWKNTFIQKGLIFQKKGEKIIPLFVLRKQVEIPPSKWFRNSVEKSEPILLRIMETRMNQV